MELRTCEYADGRLHGHGNRVSEYGDETRKWQYGNRYGNYMIMEVRHEYRDEGL